FIQQDGEVDAAEYGNFEGVEVIPVESAWVLNWAAEKNWEGPSDSSFTFYAAYDDEYLYIGVIALDDVVRSNDPPQAFWKDDSIELLVDPLNQPYDINADTNTLQYGGHPYFNYEGRFSDWDDAAGEQNPERTSWSAAITDWEYGEDKEVYGFGQETDEGWTVEIKLHKSFFKNDDGGEDMVEGKTWAFNIGADDDDGGDLAIQYFWANRVRAFDFTPEEAEFFTEEEIANNVHYDYYETGINDNGRLTVSGAGDMIFGELADVRVSDWSLF
ncbi:hypothetical protein GF373_08505, partial [bacterium]|nr:hypothetical protein [bacterium]